ncbi:MAG: 2-amino-4-hydroxy-6-hydroxymethyldihydropteridine diphosphokinase [Pseudomonadota bacterium]
MSSSYLIALGSNRWHRLYGRPREVVHAAMEELASLGTVTARAPIISTAAVGAAQRRFANSMALLECQYDPPTLLAALKRMEREFGRRTFRRWGDRVLDLDIVLWSGGAWSSTHLQIPHPHFRERSFVLGPASAIAPGWRDPESGLSVQHFNARLTRPRALPR